MNIAITAGGTSEYIDKVRKITNSGSGRLGAMIADKIAEQPGIKVDKIYYICSEKAIIPNTEKAEIIRIKNTDDLKKTVLTTLSDTNIDWFIHSMAVSDYYVDSVTTAKLLADGLEGYDESYSIENAIKNPEHTLDNSDKISSSEDNLILVLKQTPKIIGMIKAFSPMTHLIGFKLLENVTETELIQTARKLQTKNKCDYVVANDLQHINQHEHRAHIVDEEHHTTYRTKSAIAKAIAEIIAGKPA